MSDGKKPATTDKTAGLKSKKNKNLILMIATLVSVVVIAISVTVMVLAATKDDDEADKGGQTSSAGKDDGKDEKPVETTTETLTVSNLSMKYKSPTWKKDSTTGSGEAAIYRGKDEYLMMAYTKSSQKITSKEFAEASVESYEDLGFEVKQALKAQTINGTEWQRVELYGQKAWTTVLFLANGTEYYIVTFANTTSSSAIPADVEEMIKSLTIKK